MKSKDAKSPELQAIEAEELEQMEPSLDQMLDLNDPATIGALARLGQKLLAERLAREAQNDQDE